MLRSSFRLLSRMRNHSLPAPGRTLALEALQQQMVPAVIPFRNDILELTQPERPQESDSIDVMLQRGQHMLRIKDPAGFDQQVPTILGAVLSFDRQRDKKEDYLTIGLSLSSQAERGMVASSGRYPLLTLAGPVQQGGLIVEQMELASFAFAPTPARLSAALALLNKVTHGPAHANPLAQARNVFARDFWPEYGFKILGGQQEYDMTTRLERAVAQHKKADGLRR